MTDQQKMLIASAHNFAGGAKDYARNFEALQEQEDRVRELERQLEDAREELTRRRGVVELVKGALMARLPNLP